MRDGAATKATKATKATRATKAGSKKAASKSAASKQPGTRNTESKKAAAKQGASKQPAAKDAAAKKSPASRAAASASFSAEEREAMKARARELRAEARAGRDRAAGERDVLAQIAAMPGPERSLATRVHALVLSAAPALAPKTWYGMPAYARDGKVVCFFQAASKFGSRYATLGFNDAARLDAGRMWPTAFALTGLGGDEEAAIRELVAKAAG